MSCRSIVAASPATSSNAARIESRIAGERRGDAGVHEPVVDDGCPRAGEEPPPLEDDASGEKMTRRIWTPLRQSSGSMEVDDCEYILSTKKVGGVVIFLN